VVTSQYDYLLDEQGKGSNKAEDSTPSEEEAEEDGMNNIEVQFSDDSQEKAPINSQDFFEENDPLEAAGSSPMNI